MWIELYWWIKNNNRYFLFGFWCDWSKQGWSKGTLNLQSSVIESEPEIIQTVSEGRTGPGPLADKIYKCCSEIFLEFTDLEKRDLSWSTLSKVKGRTRDLKTGHTISELICENLIVKDLGFVRELGKDYFVIWYVGWSVLKTKI